MLLCIGVRNRSDIVASVVRMWPHAAHAALSRLGTEREEPVVRTAECTKSR